MKEYKEGYNKAQEEIAKRLLNDKYKESNVAKWTGLTLAKVIVIRHEEDIERMIKKGILRTPLLLS